MGSARWWLKESTAVKTLKEAEEMMRDVRLG